MDPIERPYPRSWVLLAKAVSFLFHPLLVGLYMAWFLIYRSSGFFQYQDPKVRAISLATVVVNNFLFPLVVVLLLKALGFIGSVYLRTQKERIVPYMASIIFFFWTWYVFYNRPDSPQILRDTLQGIFYAAIMSSAANVYFKISMHAIGMGGCVGMMVACLFTGSLFSPLPLAMAVLLTGLVLSSRLITGDHQRGDVLAGFLVGLSAQALAHSFL